MRGNVDRPIGGYTLVEMMVAVSMAGIVSILIMGAYTGLFKGFEIQAGNAAEAQAMILGKKQIDRMMRSLRSVTEVSPRGILGANDRDSIINISYVKGVLSDGIQSVSLDSFSCMVKKTEYPDGPAYLIWDATVPGGKWIGGAVGIEIRVERESNGS